MQIIFGFLGLLIIHYKYLIRKIVRYNLHKTFRMIFIFILSCIYCRQEKFFVHSGTTSRLYNPITKTWDTATGSEENGSTKTQHPLAEFKTQYEYSRTNPGQGTSLLLPLFPTTSPTYRARIMIIGGAGSDNPVIHTPATETVEIIDFGELNPR
jgi:hypothetical protein